MGKITDKNGFWFIEKNPVTKVGVYPYSGKQISQDCEPNKIYYVLRPKEELFKKETLESLRLIPIVDGHTMIGKDWTAPETKGIDGILGDNVSHDTDTIYNDIKIISNKMKDEIKNGKKQLSLGYFCRYDKQPGTYKGQRYDYVQRNIIANHLALVKKGRMGADVRVYDSKDGASFAMDSLDIVFDKEEPEYWFSTKNGVHIPVFKGQTQEEAKEKFFENKQNTKVKKINNVAKKDFERFKKKIEKHNVFNRDTQKQIKKEIDNFVLQAENSENNNISKETTLKQIQDKVKYYIKSKNISGRADWDFESAYCEKAIEYIKELNDNEKFIKETETKLFTPDEALKENFVKQAMEQIVDTSNDNPTIDMGKVPFLYQELGIKDVELKTNKQALKKATKTKHNVPDEVAENLVEYVYNPRAVFKSLSTSSNPNGYVAILDATYIDTKNNEEKPILAILSPSKDGKGFTLIPTIYERNKFQGFLKDTAEEGKILYIESKERGSDIWGQLQLLPRQIQNLNNSIKDKKQIVKSFIEKGKDIGEDDNGKKFYFASDRTEKSSGEFPSSKRLDLPDDNNSIAQNPKKCQENNAQDSSEVKNKMEYKTIQGEGKMEELYKFLQGKISQDEMEEVKKIVAEQEDDNDEEAEEDEKEEKKEVKDKKTAKDKCGKDENKDDKKDDDKKDDDKKEADKDEKKGMDEGEIFKMFARKEKLAKEVEDELGTFDHSEMTELEVAKYACDKLELGAAEGQELATLKGYLKGIAKVPKAIYGYKKVAQDSGIAEDEEFEKFTKGE